MKAKALEICMHVMWVNTAKILGLKTRILKSHFPPYVSVSCDVKKYNSSDFTAQKWVKERSHLIACIPVCIEFSDRCSVLLVYWMGSIVQVERMSSGEKAMIIATKVNKVRNCESQRLQIALWVLPFSFTGLSPSTNPVEESTGLSLAWWIL